MLSWVECPPSLTGGSNLQIYVKPGSHPWDARFQVRKTGFKQADGVLSRKIQLKGVVQSSQFAIACN